MVQHKLAQYAEIRRVAWEAYDRSHLDAEKVVEEFGPAVEDDDDDKPNGKPSEKYAVGYDPNSMKDSEVRIKRIMTREGRLPANAYLQTIMETLAAERKMLGLDAEEAPTTVVNVVNFDMLATSLSEPIPDPVGDKLRQLELKEGQDEGITIDPPVPVQDLRSTNPAGQA